MPTISKRISRGFFKPNFSRLLSFPFPVVVLWALHIEKIVKLLQAWSFSRCFGGYLSITQRAGDQLISKANCQAVDSPNKKGTNGVWLYYVTTLQVKKSKFVRSFFGESTAWQFAFEINWPLPQSLPTFFGRQLTVWKFKQEYWDQGIKTGHISNLLQNL